MKTTYESIPVIAHVVGSKSRKAMYLVQPQSLDGSKIYKNAWVPTKWHSKRDDVHYTVQWESTSESYIELPMSQVTPSMLIETVSTYGVGDTLINERLVNNKVQRYVALQRRFIIYVPKFAMQNLQVKYSKVIEKEEDNDLFHNEYSHYSIADEMAHESQQQIILQDRPDYSWTVTGGIENSPQLEQWLKDNPEYQNDISIYNG